mgnify:CR=1 FL=1
MLALGQHYDGPIGYTEFRGGALQFVGFNVIKVRECEALALKYGKRFTYDTTAMHMVAVDDVDGPPVAPSTPKEFVSNLLGSPEIKYGPKGGAIQKLEVNARQISSSSLRNVLASKTVLDVWLKKDVVVIWIIPQSRITNGLFEQAQKAAPPLPNRRKWSVKAPRRVYQESSKGSAQRAFQRLRKARRGQQRSPLKPKSTWLKRSKKSVPK